MAVPIRNTYVVGQALARLTSSYINQPNVRALVWSYMQPAQDLENVLFDVIQSRILKTATLYALPTTNTILDTIGTLVGVPRGGLSDSDYIVLIYLGIAVNRATGAIGNWSGFAKILQGYYSALYYLDGVASVYFGLWDLTLSPVTIGAILERALGNGIGGVFAYSVWPDGDDFSFSSVHDSSAGQAGWSSVTDPTVGGLMVACAPL
jgi:hypothetical protein